MKPKVKRSKADIVQSCDFTFTIPKKLESANKYNNWHWATRKKDKDNWQWVLKAISSSILWHFCTNVQTRKLKVKLTVVSYRKRLCDTDNLYGGSLKGLLDALKREKYIYDDSPEYLELVVKQERSKEEYTKLYFKII